MPVKKIIAITGGIGAGKSVVQSILTAMGFDVYDCDRQAKALMDSDKSIIEGIAQNICPQSVTDDNQIDKSVLADHVFKNKEALDKLNKLVHKQVIEDFRKWKEGRHIAFIETAILCTSGLDKDVDEVWEVTAPESVRISRVKIRNPHLKESQIISRIESQRSEESQLKALSTFEIKNDGIAPVLPQIESLLDKL